jgi:type IV secretory pathway ATPase VirB11/archaellum biosynthesis ATPase
MDKEIEDILDKHLNTFSKKNHDISEIEEKIDNLILKNKHLSEKISSKKLELDKISLKSKDRDQVYYLRVKFNKKPKQENKNSKKVNKKPKEINKKISKKAKIKLGQKSNKKTQSKDKNKKTSKKTKTNLEKKSDKKIQDKAEKEKSKNPVMQDTKKTSNFIDKKIMSAELMEVVPDKKYYKKLKKAKKKKLKKSKSKKKIDKKIEQQTDIPEKTKELINSHKLSLIKIGNETDQKIDDLIKHDKKMDNLNFQKDESKTSTKDFFKSKKDSKKKGFLFGNKNKSKPQSNKPESEDIKSKKHFFKPKFKVENLPEKKDLKEEFNFIDKKIKETPKSKQKNKTFLDTELKAKKLVEDHIKNKPFDNDKKIEEKTTLEDKNIDYDYFVADDDKEHEHVFFDEHESSYEGWSPSITEKEKRELSLPISSQPETYTGDKLLTKDIELPPEVLNLKSVKLEDLGFSKEDWEELEFYPLYEPFAYVEILREKDTLEKCYFLIEMEITKEEKEIINFIKETMKRSNFNTEELESKGDNKYLENTVEEILSEYSIRIDPTSKQKILYYLGKTSLGLGKLDPLMKDPNIEDISCDGSNIPLFLYHRTYGSVRSNIKFNDEDELSSFIYRLAQKCGKHISIAEPMLDATMPDGSRIQMTLSDEITAKGSTFTIRKFKDDPFSPPDLFEYNTMSSEMIAYMWLAVENGINTLFAGGTASGKTTALNAISLFIPYESKVVSIEETRELNLPHVNWIPGLARTGFGGVIVDDKMQGEIDMYDLMKAALRQRPEYILVGEIRGKEAYVLFQAMATGHATYSTVHADSAQSLIHRLEGKPINIPRVMLQSLDIISLHIITKIKNKRARRCKQIIEIIDIDPTTKEILTNEVFRWDPIEDHFKYSGKSYILERIRAEKDMSREEMTQEIKKRQTIIEWMNKNNIRQFRDVANLITRYAESPNEVISDIKREEEKING